MPTTTALSTTETDRLVDLLMPAGHAALLRKACDCYSKSKVKAAAARDKRTQDLQTQVYDAIYFKQARLKREPRHKWTSILMKYYFELRKIAIDEETIRKYVKTFPGF